ncbi:MAG: HlyD family type I secretion periplasmic adaptor subunit, partial [Proteobacteria bacterium]|nr:HlyD family type I secretion periplasmic adaptor subunit [Pseudomonadota bacterium]
QAQLGGQMIRRARLTAQAGGTEVLFPPEEGARQPEIVQSERRSFEARQRELRSMESRLRIQAQQRGLEVQEFISQRASLARELVNVREKYTISADLLEDGLTTRVEHLGLEQEAEKIRGKLEVIDVAIPRTRSALEEAEERIREARLTSRREANEALAKVDAEIARTRETLSKASDQVDRSVITSPIDGVIKTVFVNTIGGVIGPGQPLMEIVPSGQALVIEAKLSPNDIGFVRVGQRVVVKISTYDFVRYGGLDGVVSEVAPDSSFEDNGDAYFRVRVRTDKTYLGAEPGSLPISAGMLATVDIKTGNKTVAEYLVRPVLKLRHEAFRER